MQINIYHKYFLCNSIQEINGDKFIPILFLSKFYKFAQFN